MKFLSSALFLALTATSVSAEDSGSSDVPILGDDSSGNLLSGWTLFDPDGKAELSSKSYCPTTGTNIHVSLDYVQGVNVECDGSGGCRPLIPPSPRYSGTDKWLVTNFVIGNKNGECPTGGSPLPLKNSLEVQFYAKGNTGSRSITSQPASFGRLDDSRGVVEQGDGIYETCVKVPISCQNPNPSFEGWTGISYQNRPLAAEDCEGTIDLYIDSIKVSSECPFDVPDNNDLGDNFCIDRGDGRNLQDRGVCDDDGGSSGSTPPPGSMTKDDGAVSAQSTDDGSGGLLVRFNSVASAAVAGILVVAAL